MCVLHFVFFTGSLHLPSRSTWMSSKVWKIIWQFNSKIGSSWIGLRADINFFDQELKGGNPKRYCIDVILNVIIVFNENSRTESNQQCFSINMLDNFYISQHNQRNLRLACCILLLCQDFSTLHWAFGNVSTKNSANHSS